MARLNTRISRITSGTPSSTGVAIESDEENRDPSEGILPTKDAVNEMSQTRTDSIPLRDLSNIQTTQKRKRTETVGKESQKTKYYDAHQDPEVRRDIKRASRALERDFNGMLRMICNSARYLTIATDSREELLRDTGARLNETVNRANQIFKNVKQTGDATVDSRLLVNVSDLGKKKAAQMVLGDTSTGVDIDEFLSKCISYMRAGGRSDSNISSGSATRRRRTAIKNEDSDDESTAEPLDWACFGRQACFPVNRRPPVPNFLLGPLSLEKRQRTQTQRRARQAKDTTTREARPEAITNETLSQSDENGLTAVCTKIRNRLAAHLANADVALTQAGMRNEEDLHSQRGRALLKKHRMSTNGGVSLFDFVINPQSFGQTVENLFYVSFLIKEGSLGIIPDAEGLPTLSPAKPSTLEEQRERDKENSRLTGRNARRSKSSKHQAVLALDYSTWKELIDAFDIREPMIPHRKEEALTQIGSRGWYT